MIKLGSWLREFPLIQLPRKSEALIKTAARLVLFPLIQLPRKSEEYAVTRITVTRPVSINSTSEEVRSLQFRR